MLVAVWPFALLYRNSQDIGVCCISLFTVRQYHKHYRDWVIVKKCKRSHGKRLLSMQEANKKNETKLHRIEYYHFRCWNCVQFCWLRVSVIHYCVSKQKSWWLFFLYVSLSCFAAKFKQNKRISKGIFSSKRHTTVTQNI